MAADPITTSTVDHLLDFDFSDGEDPFADNALTRTRDDKATLSPRAAKRKLDEDKENLGLGLDEEVKITKKRKPIAKLDETRLLSEPGIPRLRALARSGKTVRKLGFKGKGHEFSDIARLLNYYQLWLDGLYPRAKFADGLQLIEKAGHSKRMNVMRKEWIDEGKPGYITRFESGNNDANERDVAAAVRAGPSDDANTGAAQEEGNPDDLFFLDSGPANPGDDGVEPDEDELDALLGGNDSPSEPAARQPVPESEGEDDLDALLAEQDSRIEPAELPSRTRNVEEEDDDLDAFLADQEDRNSSTRPSEPVQKRGTMFDDDDGGHADDLDALLAEQDAPKESVTMTRGEGEALPKQTSPTKQVVTSSNILSSSPVPNNPEEEDDLDALLAEHEASI